MNMGTYVSVWASQSRVESRQKESRQCWPRTWIAKSPTKAYPRRISQVWRLLNAVPVLFRLRAVT